MLGIRCLVIIFAILAKVESDLVQKTIYIDTTGGIHYQVIPIDWFVKARRINFRVQALYDASVALFREFNNHNPLLEVVLGADENRKCYIKKHGKIVATADTPGVLDPYTYKGFWISWYTNSKYLDLKTVFMVRIGQDGDDTPLIFTWQNDPGQPAIAYYFGVRTEPNSGEGSWEIDVMYDEPNITASTQEVITNSIPRYEPRYENFYPIINNRIDFRVKVLQNAFVIVSKNPLKIVNTYYQIIIGGWGNMRCAIMTDEFEIAVEQECDGVLHPDHYRGFWITTQYVENALIISVGNDGEILPFMKYVDLAGVLPLYYSVGCTGKDRVGYWILKVSPPTLFKYVKTVETFPATYTHFDPIPKSGLILIKTKATRDAWIGLTSSHSNDPEFEIIIGGWDSEISSIRRKGIDLYRYKLWPYILDIRTFYTGFWIKINHEESMYLDLYRELNVYIQVGQEDIEKPFMHYKFATNLTHFINPKFYSVASTSDADYVEWILEASILRVDVPMPKYYISLDNSNKFHLYALEGQRVEFDVKTAQNAIISLTTSSHKPYIEISLDNDTTKIFKDGSHKATFNTYFKMNEEIYQEFWIDWKYSTKPKRELCLRFGKDENIALLEWRDPEPFLISYIGVNTRHGIGQWKFYDAWLEPESEKFIPNLIRTYNNPERYQFFPIIKSPIRFSVKASRDAYVAFTTQPNRKKPIIEVLLGAFGDSWDSQYTYIRKDFQHGSPGEVFIRTPSILSNDKYIEFWINWEYIEDYSSGLEPKMKLEVGLEGEEALLTWEGKDIFPINYVGVTGYKSNAVWMFKDDIKIIKKKQRTDVITKNGQSYQFFAVVAKPVWIQVKASSNAYVALTSVKPEADRLPIFECMIGTDGNTKTKMIFNRNESIKFEVETCGILSDSFYESFWLDWTTYIDETGKSKMAVYIGRRGDHYHFAYLIVDPFDIHYFGIKSKGNTAFWHFQEMTQSLPPYFNTYNHSNQYQFYMAPNHSLIFYIKAASDAYIALSTTNSSSDVMYEIMIGVEHNQKSFVYKNKSFDHHTYEENHIPIAKTENILSNTDLRGFWMDWVYFLLPPYKESQILRIRVGRQGEVHPFLRYYDEKPLHVNYIGFTSGYGKVLWRFKEVIEEILPDENANVVSIEPRAYDFSPENYTQLVTSNLTYQFFSIPIQNISFKVKTHSDAYIVLLSRPQIDPLFPMLELLIGGRNQKSWIKKSNENPNIIVNTPLVLNVSEFRGFWVSWDDGNIAVGFMNKNEAFMTWTDPYPFTVNFIGVTSRTSAIWKIIDSTIQTNDDDKYHFFPIATDKTMFLLKGFQNARIILTNNSKVHDPIIEIILGNKGNTEITFLREGLYHTKKVGGVLDKKSFRGYWISWAFGKFTVGLKGEPNPIAFFDDPTPVSPNYIVIASNKVTRTTWQFKVAPAWRPVQWDSDNENPCFLDPNGQECKDRTLLLEKLKKGRPEETEKRLVNDCEDDRWINTFQCRTNNSLRYTNIRI